jgi:hypothetical protein
MRKFILLGLPVTVLLLAFVLTVACDNGTTKDETPEVKTTYTDGDVSIIFSNKTIDLRARAVGPYHGDNYLIMKGSAILSQGTVELSNDGDITFIPKDEGERFTGQLRNGVLAINTTLDGQSLIVNATTIPDNVGGGTGGGSGGGTGDGPGGTGIGSGSGSASTFVPVTGLRLKVSPIVTIKNDGSGDHKQNVTLAADILPANSNAALLSAAIAWKEISPPAGVSVNEGTGEVTVTGYTGKLPATFQVLAVVPYGLSATANYTTTVSVTLMSEDAVVEPQSIQVSASTLAGLNLNAGSGKVTLSATVLPADATFKLVTWSIPNTAGLKIYGDTLVADGYYGKLDDIALTAKIDQADASNTLNTIGAVNTIPITPKFPNGRFMRVGKIVYDFTNAGRAGGLAEDAAALALLDLCPEDTPGNGSLTLPSTPPADVIAQDADDVLTATKPTINKVVWKAVTTATVTGIGDITDLPAGITITGNTITAKWTETTATEIFLAAVIEKGAGAGDDFIDTENEALTITIGHAFVPVKDVKLITSTNPIEIEVEADGEGTFATTAAVELLDVFLDTIPADPVDASVAPEDWVWTSSIGNALSVTWDTNGFKLEIAGLTLTAAEQAGAPKFINLTVTVPKGDSGGKDYKKTFDAKVIVAPATPFTGTTVEIASITIPAAVDKGGTAPTTAATFGTIAGTTGSVSWNPPINGGASNDEFEDGESYTLTIEFEVTDPTTHRFATGTWTFDDTASAADGKVVNWTDSSGTGATVTEGTASATATKLTVTFNVVIDL